MKNCVICDKELTKKQKSYCSKACQGKGYLGKKHTEESLLKMRGRKLSVETIWRQNKSKTREKIRVEGEYSCYKCFKSFEANTSLRAHMSYCSGTIAIATTCVICNATFKSERSYKIHNSLKHASADIIEARRCKMMKAKMNNTVRCISAAEEAFFKKVQEIYPDAIHSFVIPNSSHVYDIYIQSINTIIEFDGDFWHGNKKLYELSARMKQQYRIDESNKNKAEILGFKLIRVWQSESEQFLTTLRGMHVNNND